MKFEHVAVPSRINFKYVLFHSARTVVAYLRYYYYFHRSLLSMYWIEGQRFSINSKIRFNSDDKVGNGYCCYIKLSSIVHLHVCDRWFDVRTGYAFSVLAFLMHEVFVNEKLKLKSWNNWVLIGNRGHGIQVKMHSCRLEVSSKDLLSSLHSIISFHFFYHLCLPCSSR